MKQLLAALAMTLGGLLVVAEEAQPVSKPFASLEDMSIEQLANLEVTSVAKKETPLSQAPAAIYVMTQDDLRRSGVTSIPEALRQVPGLEVGRVNAHTWAISGRGFNDTFADKLLVLIDGRSVYTPLFSGVYWDVQDTLIEDIERIEVIRGPGATLWGANAVNGVINIITKSTRDPQGGLLSAGGGTVEQGFGSIRYGANLNENSSYRVYAKYFDHGASDLPDGSAANDRWQMARGGFRMDWDQAGVNLFTLQGDLYGGELHQTETYASLAFPYTTTVADDVRVNGGNILGRWTHTFSADSELQLQFYYDRTWRKTSFVQETRNTVDVDLQHRLQFGQRQDIVWGLGYRLLNDDIVGSFPVSFNPDSRTTEVYSAFLQDEITVLPERLRLTVGSKFEHNDYTGFEIEPGARLEWTPNSRNTLWASVARAVRTPSRAENDVRLNQSVSAPGFAGAATQVVSIFGSPNFVSETLLAYELGYRIQPADRLSLDVAAFYNKYNDLRTSELTGFDPADPTLAGSPDVVHFTLENLAEGETYGAEVGANLQLTDWWRCRMAYTYLQIQLHTKPGSNDANAEADEGKSPRNQVSIRSSMDLSQHVQFDAMLRYVEQLPQLYVPSYLSLDLRLAWRPTHNLELSIVGQNLLQERHTEFVPTIIPTQQTEVPRGVYGNVTIHF